MLIDTHAHLTFPDFSSDLSAVIERARAGRIEAIINIALDQATIEHSLSLSSEYNGYIFTAAGVHPQDAVEWKAETEIRFRDLLAQKRIVAVGETGLDYHYQLSPIEIQQTVFRHFLRLAQEFDLPAIIHSREAASDTGKILRQESTGQLRGVLHCFDGDQELAHSALDLGLYFSFTGNITFPKAEKIRTAVAALPLDRILVETDCPFLAPQTYRGKRNEPAYVSLVAEKIAQIKKLDYQEVAEITTRNARNLFKLS
jgi:TatD DNase family protein